MAVNKKERNMVRRESGVEKNNTSRKIQHKLKPLFTGALAVVLCVTLSPLASQTTNAGTVYCASAASDPDGDGWGWENNQSCVVKDGDADNTGPGYPVCDSPSSDPDGDGWGWENNQSCLVKNIKEEKPIPYCDQLTSDSDGDGWGWENNESCQVYQPSDITDLILITGQSNTLGAETETDAALDTPNARVFAYTNNGWQAAQLFQTWDRNSYPGPGDANADDSFIYNNFALHFGKRMAQLDPDRVIGFVLISEPGMGISNWNPGAPGMVRVQSKALEALNALPHKSAFDGILWHQGETDWQLIGTSDTMVEQPAPDDYYPTKLAELISNFRSEGWYSAAQPFICGETIRALGVNEHLRALNTDNDPMTACVAGEGLPATTTPGSHFTGAALRTMGQWYAEQYFSMTE
jgi:hypothetical protein